MVEIQCPHCVEIIELEDGLFGLFDCPLCEAEFEWSPERNSSREDKYSLVKLAVPCEREVWPSF